MAKRKKKPTPIEAFEALPAAEKERQAAEFDKEFVANTFRPLTPAQRRLWKKARRKPGRPRVGQGTKIVSLTPEKGLLRRVDAAAKKRKLKRTELVSQALEAVLSRGRDDERRGLRSHPYAKMAADEAARAKAG
jgi:hypothetical protein